MRLFFVIVGLLSLAQFSSSKDEPRGNELVKAAINGDAEKVELLLRSGVPIDSQTEEGHTALMLAAGDGKTKIVKLLLKERADVNVQATHKCYELF